MSDEDTTPDQPQPILPTVAREGAPTTRRLISEATDQPESPDYLSGETQNLLAALVQQSARHSAFTANALIDSYKGERDTLAATLKAIRTEMQGILSGLYMPTPAALFECLYPSDAVIDEYREG